MDEFLKAAQEAFRNLHGLPLVPANSAARPPETIIPKARQHRVMGLLEAGLSLSARFDKGTSTSWQRAVFGQAQHSARCTNEAEKLFTLLSARINCVALIKGPALSAQAWPNPGLRSYDDLDFRCGIHDYPILHQLMTSAGYTTSPADNGRNENLWNFGWGVTFRHAEGFMVEVNHRFFPPHYPWPPHLDAELPKLHCMEKLDSGKVRSITPAVHLLLSCMHAIWHGWERLAWVVDIAGLLTRHPESITEADQLIGKTCFARRALHTGCRVAETIFGPGLALTPTPCASPAAVGTAMELLMRDTPGVSWNKQRACHEQLMGTTERMAYTVRRLATPGDPDFCALTLRGPTRRLYWIVRPVRGLIQRTRTDIPAE